MRSSALLVEPIPPAIGKYDERNEHEHRQQTSRELAQKWDRRSHLIVPYGKLLGFSGPDGEVATFGFDGDGNFAITIDYTTETGFASVSMVAEVAADLATLTTEVVAARDGEASLSARFSEIITAYTGADSALATRTTTLEAQVQDPSTGLLARVTTTETALAGGGVASALLAFEVNTGTNVASLRLFSIDGGIWNGSVITLSADQIILDGSVIATGTFTVDRIEGGALGFENLGYGAGGGLSTGYTNCVSADYALNDTGIVLAQGGIGAVIGTPTGLAGSGFDEIICYAAIMINGVGPIGEMPIGSWLFFDGVLTSSSYISGPVGASNGVSAGVGSAIVVARVDKGGASAASVTGGHVWVRALPEDLVTQMEP